MPIFIVMKKESVPYVILREGICVKLTHKSLKRGQREPVSPVVDTEDLYRRYLRIRAEREYFREDDGRD
jgi:hypothetical protein